MKELKSKLNYNLIGILGFLIFFSCETQKPTLSTEPTLEVKDSIDVTPTVAIDSISEEVIDYKCIESIKDIYGFELSVLTENYLQKKEVENENDFLILYQHLDGLRKSYNENKSPNFDKYYKTLVSDTIINTEIRPLNFSCIEECTSPYIGIDTESLMTIANISNSTKAKEFTTALNYAYSGIENDYVSFLEYCDECFGATSNIGDDRIYGFLKLNKPFLNDHSILGDRLRQITEESLKLAIGETYRYNSEKVTLELQKWIDEELLEEKQLKLVQQKIEEIKSNPEKNQFNYTSDSYPEMHN